MSDQLPLTIHIDKSDGVVLSDDVRSAIERLAAAVAADESLVADVTGFANPAPKLEIGPSLTSALGNGTAWRVCMPARNDKTDLCFGIYYHSDEIVGR
jgi:hypothetical protein